MIILLLRCFGTISPNLDKEANSLFSCRRNKIPVAPEDPVFGLTARFKADTHPQKLNLGVGAYRDENAQPWVLPVVRKVEQLLANDAKQNKEYLDISGLKEFSELASQLILGKEFYEANKSRIASCQSTAL